MSAINPAFFILFYVFNIIINQEQRGFVQQKLNKTGHCKGL
jgi:hypothetical protein